MEKKLSEAQVLRALDIPDFRHMTKDKVIQFASMIQTMDPAVAQKALEQFPNFAEMSLEALKDYKSVLEKAADKNAESSENCMNIYGQIIKSLQDCLSKENIPFEEKKFYIEQMKEIAKSVDQKDTENKKFNAGLVTAGFAALAFVVGGAAALLGGKLDIHFPMKKS